MPNNLLVLTPDDPRQEPPEREALLQRLGAIGFIGEHREGESFKPGDRFLQLVTFLGCSPVVSLGEPGATGDEFCHIEFPTPTSTPQFIAGDNVKTPRCPSCRKPLEGWRERLANPAASEPCPHCGAEASLFDLNWRQSAGFGRSFITVWGIFEGEAVPGGELLAALREIGGGEWEYFYVRRQESTGCS